MAESWVNVTEMTHLINATYASEHWTPIDRQRVQYACAKGLVKCRKTATGSYLMPKSNLQVLAERFTRRPPRTKG